MLKIVTSQFFKKIAFNSKYEVQRRKRKERKRKAHTSHTSHVGIWWSRDFRGPVGVPGFMGPAPEYVIQIQTVQTVQIVQTSNIKLPR